MHLADLERGPTTYRVFLLPDALQFDLSMTPAGRFRPAGPRFRLLSARRPGAEPDPTPTAGDLFIATPSVPTDIFGWGVIYALHSRACIERGRGWQAEHHVGAVRDHALSLACLRQGLPAVQARSTTIFPRRPWPGSRMPTSSRSSPRLRKALAAAVHALMREGAEARLPHAEVVGERLAEVG